MSQLMTLFGSLFDSNISYIRLTNQANKKIYLAQDGLGLKRRRCVLSPEYANKVLDGLF